ncbi:hypothetical protein AVEN_241275-1 [Araneus ventricosus]|uniref:Uncharacterized protein n=1 Tax=Araneus ventricosus TaxID=182803 RepID=A0A4Y2NLE0_ARAVE|nr:hypothetical protein AVEN_241275-1 [Araneus ventricosus]
MDRSKIQALIGSDDQRLFSSPSKLENSERYLKYPKMPSHILSLLCWTGLLEDSQKSSRKRIVARMLPVLLMLFTVDVVVRSLIPVNVDFFRASISLCSYIMSVPIWFAMRRRRKQLTAFLRLLHEIHRQAMTWKISLSLYGICISPVIFAALKAITSNRAELTTQLVYGYSIESLHAQLVLIFVKIVLYSTIYPMCPTIFAFLLCLFCQRICDKVRSLILLIEKCSPKQFTVSFHTIENILNQKRRIDDSLLGLCRFSMHRKISMLLNRRRSDVYIVVFSEASKIPIYPRCFPMHRRCPHAPRRAIVPDRASMTASARHSPDHQ